MFRKTSSNGKLLFTVFATLFAALQVGRDVVL